MVLCWLPYELSYDIVAAHSRGTRVIYDTKAKRNMPIMRNLMRVIDGMVLLILESD